MCESSGVVGIETNPPHVGLMQANVNLWGRVTYDPIAELNQGYYIYTLQGFEAWECYQMKPPIDWQPCKEHNWVAGIWEDGKERQFWFCLICGFVVVSMQYGEDDDAG